MGHANALLGKKYLKYRATVVGSKLCPGTTRPLLIPTITSGTVQTQSTEIRFSYILLFPHQLNGDWKTFVQEHERMYHRFIEQKLKRSCGPHAC